MPSICLIAACCSTLPDGAASRLPQEPAQIFSSMLKLSKACSAAAACQGALRYTCAPCCSPIEVLVMSFSLACAPACMTSAILAPLNMS